MHILTVKQRNMCSELEIEPLTLHIILHIIYILVIVPLTYNVPGNS